MSSGTVALSALSARLISRHAPSALSKRECPPLLSEYWELRLRNLGMTPGSAGRASEELRPVTRTASSRLNETGCCPERTTSVTFPTMVHGSLGLQTLQWRLAGQQP